MQLVRRRRLLRPICITRHPLHLSSLLRHRHPTSRHRRYPLAAHSLLRASLAFPGPAPLVIPRTSITDTRTRWGRRTSAVATRAPVQVSGVAETRSPRVPLTMDEVAISLL